MQRTLLGNKLMLGQPCRTAWRAPPRAVFMSNVCVHTAGRLVCGSCPACETKGCASQRSLHNAPIFRLLLKVAVKGTHQCDFLNFCGAIWPQQSKQGRNMKRDATNKSRLPAPSRWVFTRALVLTASGSPRAQQAIGKLTWLVLGGDPAARSHRVEQFTAL